MHTITAYLRFMNSMWCVQARCAGYLEQLSSGHALLLRASRPAKDASVAEIEKISKTVTVCTGACPTAMLLDTNGPRLSTVPRQRLMYDILSVRLLLLLHTRCLSIIWCRVGLLVCCAPPPGRCRDSIGQADSEGALGQAAQRRRTAQNCSGPGAGIWRPGSHARPPEVQSAGAG